MLISRPCSTMNESFIIPVPWFAEYRVNVTTDLWVKNGNGKEPRGGDPVHAMRACNYRGAFASFQRFKVYSVSRRRSLRGGGHGFATVGKSDKQPGAGGEEEEEEVSSSRANRARSASAYKPFYLYAARLIN